MFSNVLEEKHYIQEVVDPETGKHYNLHIRSCVPTNSPQGGMICNDFYLTDSNPYHDVQVGIGRKAFFPDEFDTQEEMTAELDKIIKACLPAGCKRFEAIMASGIKGNELPH